MKKLITIIKAFNTSKKFYVLDFHKIAIHFLLFYMCLMFPVAVLDYLGLMPLVLLKAYFYILIAASSGYAAYEIYIAKK